MQLDQTLGNILTITEQELEMSSCNLCNMSWYRDLSAFYGGAKSVPLLAESAHSSRHIVG